MSKHKVLKEDEFKKFTPVDIFIMNSVLEHVQDVNDIMLLIKKMLKPGGLFVFTVMDFRKKHIKKNTKQLNRGKPALTKVLNPIEHVNVYDYSSVIKTIENHNFRLIGTNKTMNLTNFPVLSKNKKLLNTLNFIEKITSKIFTDKRRGITVNTINY